MSCLLHKDCDGIVIQVGGAASLAFPYLQMLRHMHEMT